MIGKHRHLNWFSIFHESFKNSHGSFLYSCWIGEVTERLNGIFFCLWLKGVIEKLNENDRSGLKKEISESFHERQRKQVNLLPSKKHNKLLMFMDWLKRKSSASGYFSKRQLKITRKGKSNASCCDIPKLLFMQTCHRVELIWAHKKRERQRHKRIKQQSEQIKMAIFAYTRKKHHNSRHNFWSVGNMLRESSEQ